MKEISLDTMEGYQFQEFIADLFKKLGFQNVEVGPPAADGGVDIFMEQKMDIGTMCFVAECKHHPKSSIGRPVVQKLHSVVIHRPAIDKGIIVTSGHFSNQAIRYAEEVGIELIDNEKLEELARKAEISIQKEPLSAIETCFPISGSSNINKKMIAFLQSDLRGFDQEFTKISEIRVRLRPLYVIDYFINSTFSTSVGLIHSINETSVLFLTGDGGELVNPIITQSLLPLQNTISELKQDVLSGIKILEKRKFAKNYKEINETAKETLRRLYTKKVSYYGANNIRYTKICTPRKKDITLGDVRRVYLPLLSFTISILKNEYAAAGIETPHGVHLLPNSLIKPNTQTERGRAVKVYPDECMVCSKAMKHEKYVCSECGIIVCGTCSAKCKMCGKVICKEHTISKRRFLILSDKYCTQCAKSEGIVS